jgi:putative hydrolase of the HAD superfamily
MSSIRAVLFDAGGTLIHVDGARVCAAAGAAWRSRRFESAENRAVSAVQKWVRAHPSSTDADRLPLFLETLLAELGVSPELRAEAGRAVAAEHRRSNLWSRAYSDAAASLETLRRAATGWASFRTPMDACAACSKRRTCRATWTSSSTPPRRASKSRTLASSAWRPTRSGLEPMQCVYVGDIYEIDVLGARAAGLDAILIGPGHAPEDVTRVANLTELVEAPALAPSHLSRSGISPTTEFGSWKTSAVPEIGRYTA